MNVGIGCILGGVGAVINKDPDQRVGSVFLKGMGQGALGGYLVFESKRLVREFSKTGDYSYVWPSKIVNSAGTSIIENAAANRDFWARWHLNIGFNRIEVNTKENFRLSYRILPFSFLATGYAATQGKLDTKTSIKIGAFTFRKKSEKDEPYGSATANAMIINSGITGNLALPHEIIHIYQYESFSGINSYFPKLESNYAKELRVSSFYNFYQKVFHTDYNYLLKGLLYLMADIPGYSKNIFEIEAEYYSENLVRQGILRN